jgi:antitoxin VapB
MALNIKDPEAERLAAEVAELAGESKTRAVRVALGERRERLVLRSPRPDRGRALGRFLEEEVWPQIPEAELGRSLTRAEREAILGYGSEGV